MYRLAEMFQQNVAQRCMEKMATVYDFLTKEAGHHQGLTKKDYKFLRAFIKAFPEYDIPRMPNDSSKYKEIMKRIGQNGGLWYHTSLGSDRGGEAIKEMISNQTGADYKGPAITKTKIKAPLGVMGNGGTTWVEGQVADSWKRIPVTKDTVIDGKTIMPDAYTSNGDSVTMHPKDAPMPFSKQHIDNLFNIGYFTGSDKNINNSTQPFLDSQGKNKTSYTISATGRNPDETYGEITHVFPESAIEGQKPKIWLKDLYKSEGNPEYRVFPNIVNNDHIETPYADAFTANYVDNVNPASINKNLSNLKHEDKISNRVNLVPLHQSTINKIDKHLPKNHIKSLIQYPPVGETPPGEEGHNPYFWNKLTPEEQEATINAHKSNKSLADAMVQYNEWLRNQQDPNFTYSKYKNLYDAWQTLAANGWSYR